MHRKLGASGMQGAPMDTREKREIRPRERHQGPRKGTIARPGTSKRSAKAIRIAQRREEVLELRLRGYSYEAIGKHVGVSKSQVERDVIAAMREMTAEPAERMFKMEMARLDALAAAHYVRACDGDIPATQMMLRIIEMRGRMLGFFDKERASARLMISEGGGAGAENKRLEVEFIVPGKRIADIDGLDAISPPCSRPSSPSLSSLPSSSSPSSRTMDLEADLPSSGVPLMLMSRKPTDWMG
jgi:hypothetical protein